MEIEPDITAKLSLFLCDKLSLDIPGVTFLPEQGKTGSYIPEPGPYAVPLIMDSNQVHPPAEVYMVEVHLALQTNPNDTTPEFHNDTVRQMLAVIQKIKASGPKYDEARAIFINGLYVVGARPIPSENNLTSVIEVHVACQLMYHSS